MSENNIEIGQRVKYQDIACRGIGYVRAINPHNRSIILVEVEEKDLIYAGFKASETNECGYELATNVGANMRMFWKKELETR